MNDDGRTWRSLARYDPACDGVTVMTPPIRKGAM